MRAQRSLAALAAAAALIVGIRWGTSAAGGSDSYCYLSEAELFASGRTHLDLPIAAGAPWRGAASSFVPVGHRLRSTDEAMQPGSTDSAHARAAPPGETPSSVPICPPGLPLLMAAATVAGGRDAALLVVPILGTAAVWLTFLLGMRLSGPTGGAASAILLACSPIFLYQVVQPMTDVPATAWWLAAIVLAARASNRTIAVAGAATGMALLTRPNLFLLAPILAGYIALASIRPAAPNAPNAPYAAFKPLLYFCAGALPFLLALAWLQNEMYGGPGAVGYGRPGQLYAAANVLPNLWQYPAWLIETHTPFLLLAPAAIVLPYLGIEHGRAGAGVRERIRLRWLCLLLSGAVLVSYLPYFQFHDWSYIRFLLPAVPLLIVLSLSVVTSLAHLMPSGARPVMVAGLTAAVCAVWIQTARERNVFHLQAFEARFIEAGRFVARELPENAAVVTVSESGSVPYYSGRPTLVWDALPTEELDRAIAFLAGRGYAPFILLEPDEEPAFRTRFGGRSELANLDWPPRAVIRTQVRVRIYDPADRARYHAGSPVITTQHWPAAGAGR